MRILAIDPGERRLGLAISDPSGTVALPLDVLERLSWAKDLTRLRAVVADQHVERVIVGRPLTSRGEEGPQAQRAARFAARLREALSLPVEEVDERFTTAAAERAMQEGGVRARDRRGRVDAVAAALLLQGYLDRRRREEGQGTLRGVDEGVMLAP